MFDWDFTLKWQEIVSDDDVDNYDDDNDEHILQ